MEIHERPLQLFRAELNRGCAWPDGFGAARISTYLMLTNLY